MHPQVDLNNQTHPIQTATNYHQTSSIYDLAFYSDIFIKQNEVTLEDNMLGFLSEETEPIQFLSIEKSENKYVKNL